MDCFDTVDSRDSMDKAKTSNGRYAKKQLGMPL